MWHRAKNWLQSLYRQILIYVRLGYIPEKVAQVKHKIPVPELKTPFIIECLGYSVTLCKVGNPAVSHSHGH